MFAFFFFLTFRWLEARKHEFGFIYEIQMLKYVYPGGINLNEYTL